MDSQLISKDSIPVIEQEEIIVKPSTELIPDEYEHFTNDTVSVHIFLNKDTDESVVESFLKTLQNIGYGTGQANVHTMEDWKSIENDLDTIKGQNKMNALIILFIGISEQDGTFLLQSSKNTIHFKSIFNKFTANSCKELKNKAKIFIFCPLEYKSPVETDGALHYTTKFEQVYDIPVEADMLIVYKKLKNLNTTFINQLSKNITDFGKKWDIIDLITNTDQNESVPLIISTLTRKFYIIASENRGHHLSINEHYETLSKTLELIKNKMHLVEDERKKTNDKKRVTSKIQQTKSVMVTTDCSASTSTSSQKNDTRKLSSTSGVKEKKPKLESTPIRRWR